MKILIMCEGPNEKAVVEILLDAGCLKFSRDDLVGLDVYHARQLTSPVIKANLNIYTGDFEVYRKANVVYNRKRYDNSTQFYRDYFGRDIDALVNSIKKYKQTHGAHNKGEGYLADLLKEK